MIWHHDNRLILITGGIRGGKSRYATERLAEETGGVLFVATAMPSDDELRERIEKHRSERPATWRTVEAVEGPLAPYLKGGERSMVLDCLTLYVGRRITEGASAADVAVEIDEAVGRMIETFALSVVVTNEVGCGIIPDNAMARHYSEVLGRANQHIAARASEVVFMVSGISLRVK
jgi:adenosylcobinamide kinase / adenosylcobinamide-phosphate guanylyltransferase